METAFGAVLAAVLVFVSLFFGTRQRRVLHQLRRDDQMPDDERRYLSRQVRRRLLCSVLLLVFAGFLVGWLFMAPAIRGIVPVQGEPIAEDAKDEVRFLVYYWTTALFILLAILLLASWDFLATARFGLRRHKQLEEDRRIMLDMEAARLRQRRQELN